MDRDRFDDLTKRVALEGTSRRRVLASLGGGLMGALLSGLGARGAGAAGGGNSAAAKWCHETFTGAAAGECTSLAARGIGPYYGCDGPGHPECPEGYGCSDGACVPIENEPECDSDTPCPPCFECSDGACVAIAGCTPCDSVDDCPSPMCHTCTGGICMPMNNTTCGEGSGVCLDGECFRVLPYCEGSSTGTVAGVDGVDACLCPPTPSNKQCKTTGDCPSGEFCLAYDQNLPWPNQCKSGCLLH